MSTPTEAERAFEAWYPVQGNTLPLYSLRVWAQAAFLAGWRARQRLDHQLISRLMVHGNYVDEDGRFADAINAQP